MAAEANVYKSEKEHADALLAQLDLPPEVQSISTIEGIDETGDPALFIHLHLAKDAIRQLSDAKKITPFRERVQVLLLGNGITRFPYVFLDEAT